VWGGKTRRPEAGNAECGYSPGIGVKMSSSGLVRDLSAYPDCFCNQFIKVIVCCAVRVLSGSFIVDSPVARRFLYLLNGKNGLGAVVRCAVQKCRLQAFAIMTQRGSEVACTNSMSTRECA